LAAAVERVAVALGDPERHHTARGEPDDVDPFVALDHVPNLIPKLVVLAEVGGVWEAADALLTCVRHNEAGARQRRPHYVIALLLGNLLRNRSPLCRYRGEAMHQEHHVLRWSLVQKQN